MISEPGFVLNHHEDKKKLPTIVNNTIVLITDLYNSTLVQYILQITI